MLTQNGAFALAPVPELSGLGVVGGKSWLDFFSPKI